MKANNTLWYQTIPTFKNQESRTLDSFGANEKYEDDFFLAYSNSIIDPNVYQNIMNDPQLQGERNKANLLNSVQEWKRIPEIFVDFESYDLFPTILHCDTFSQGQIGDCYFVDVISLISNYGELLTKLFPIKKNNHGYYEVILFINGWKRVIVDDYIPILNGKPLGCQSQKYEKCFYYLLLEKAWAKVNRNYYNIYKGYSTDSLLILTGFSGKEIVLSSLSNIKKRNVSIDMEKGIRRKGHLYGVNTNKHAYALLDVETIQVKNNNNIRNYNVLKIRNPHGNTGTLFFGNNNNLMQIFAGRRAIVEDELREKYENFNQTEDNGIFFISEQYFLQLFTSYSKCYHFFNSSTIEYLFKFKMDNLNKKYFLFKLTVNENSIVQLNLTRHFFNDKGRMIFNYYKVFIGTNPEIIDDETGTYFMKIPKGTFFIEWHYLNEAPNEILFWANYKGNINIDFMGMSDNSQIFKEGNYIFNSNEGLEYQKSCYQISKKLGEFFERKAIMYELIEDIYHCKINAEEEDRGYF